MNPGLVIGGIALTLLGGFLLWTGTGGVEWNSTHNRALQPTAHVSQRQQSINTILARVFGPLLIFAGIAGVVAGLR